MAITKDQAAQAGQIATQMDMLGAAIGNIQAALGAGMYLVAQGATVSSAPVGGTAMQLNSNFPLNQQDSATVLNALLSVYQSNLAALQAQLDAM